MEAKRRRSAAACMACVNKKARCSNFRPCQRCVDLKKESCDDLHTVLDTSLVTISNALRSWRMHNAEHDKISLLGNSASGHPWLRYQKFETKIIDSKDDCHQMPKPLLLPVSELFDA